MMKKKIVYTIFILLSLLATIKMCFLGLNIDEEYAITMSYRLATGDSMFLTMWEPHQTSSFVSAFFIRIFIVLTGGTDYLVIYLRVIGALIQAGISIFLYRTGALYFTQNSSFVAAIFFYNTLPKWIQVMEFTNLLLYFSVLSFLCLLRYYHTSAHNKLWLIGAGISLSGLVLSYPSCILTIPVYLVGMFQIHRKNFLKDITLLLGTCIVLAFGYFLYFLKKIPFSELLYGLEQMMTDGSHSYAPWARLTIYGKELLLLLPHVVGILLISLFITYYITKNNHENKSTTLIFSLVIILSLTEQLIIWLGNSMFIHFPLLYFYFIYIIGIASYTSNQTKKIIKSVFWLGSITGGAVWLSALLITNTTISVTGSYLMTGLISTIWLLGDKMEQEVTAYNASHTNHLTVSKVLCLLSTFCLLGTTLFAKGFLICENEGMKGNIFFVKQKALYGPAKGIYCRYTDGYAYNNYAELANEYLKKGENVLYVGPHSLYYLLGDVNISTYSTISTPTFDTRLLEYWDKYPNKYPNVVVCYPSESIEHIKKLVNLGKFITEEEGIAIYSVN